MAPVAAFGGAFADAGVPVSIAEIRKPMGLEKRRHLIAMLEDASIVARWRAVFGRDPSERDVDELYDSFQVKLLEILPQYADPIPGLVEVIGRLRAAGIKIGSNSGYSRRMMDALAPVAASRGFAPDCIVAADEVSVARPAPDLSLKCLELLQLENAAAIKIDDTQTGIDEGRNAGLWTVAVAVSGNEVGLSLEDWSALGAPEQTRLRKAARERAESFGADYVVDTAAELDGLLT